MPKYYQDRASNDGLTKGLSVLEISIADWNRASEEDRKELIKKPYRKAQIQYHPDKTSNLSGALKADADEKNKLLAGLFGNSALDDTVQYNAIPLGAPIPGHEEPSAHYHGFNSGFRTDPFGRSRGFNSGFGADPFGRSGGFNSGFGADPFGRSRGFNSGFGADPFGRSGGFNSGFGADPFERFFREQAKRTYNPPPLSQLEREFFDAIAANSYLDAVRVFKQAKDLYRKEVPSTWFPRLVVLPLAQQRSFLRHASPFNPKASMLLFAAGFGADLLELLRIVKRHAPGNVIPVELLNAQNSSYNGYDSLLTIACENGDLALFNFLVEEHVSLDSPESNVSALRRALNGEQPEHFEIVDRLFEIGATLSPVSYANSILTVSRKMQLKLVSYAMKMTQDEQRMLLRCLPENVHRPRLYDNILVYGLVHDHEHWLEDVYPTPPAHVQNVLDKTNFEHHFKLICAKWRELDRRAQRYPTQNNRRGVAAAAELVQTLAKAKIALYEEPNAVKATALFKKMCLDAVEKAKPELSKHRDWPKLLAGLVLALITLPVSLPLYAVGVFSLKTNSAQKLDALEKDMKKDVKSDFKPQ
jgi:hypothetical protein